MPWVTFTSDFDYTTPKKAIIAYKAGNRVNVPQKTFEEARSASVIAVDIEDDIRTEADEEQVQSDEV